MTTDSRIRVLPDLLVKKIAAGEVVERPASVVKELLENAVDAGATRIAVTIEDGGKKLIRVTDDGGGMSSDELQLAITPHATSKIMAEDDLYSIATMGFRGEALASISSVSKLCITSRCPDTIEGHQIRVAAEQVTSSQAAGCPTGTTIEVRDLFFNVPARRKFLRTHSTEMGHINEQLARVALAHPSLTFELTNNTRVTQNLPACRTRLERIAKFYGPELASALMVIERSEGDLELTAYVATPAQSRASNQWQYTFVNGRYIRDRYIQHAIKEAHRGLMEPNRHGVVFLFLTIDPQKVDVNVHPTKIEVRWAEPNMIHSQVLSALRETFQQRDLTPVLRTDRMSVPIDESEQTRVREEMAARLKASTPIQPYTPNRSESRSFSGANRVTPQAPERSPGSAVNPTEIWRSLYGSSESSRKPADDIPSPPRDHEGTARSEALGLSLPPQTPRAIQMHNLYLVAETEDGIVIVDQHALHERIMYEHLRQRITEGPLESQRLLLPETLTVTPQQAALLEQNESLWKQLGIEVNAFGSDSVAVQAFPLLLKDNDVVAFMRDLLDYLAQQSGETGPDVVIDKALSMMACKAAIKAGDPLTPEEIESLFTQKALLEKSSSCPHGRPTMLRLTKADLDRQFHRT